VQNAPLATSFSSCLSKLFTCTTVARPSLLRQSTLDTQEAQKISTVQLRETNTIVEFYERVSIFSNPAWLASLFTFTFQYRVDQWFPLRQPHDRPPEQIIRTNVNFKCWSSQPIMKTFSVEQNHIRNSTEKILSLSASFHKLHDSIFKINNSRRMLWLQVLKEIQSLQWPHTMT